MTQDLTLRFPNFYELKIKLNANAQIIAIFTQKLLCITAHGKQCTKLLLNESVMYQFYDRYYIFCVVFLQDLSLNMDGFVSKILFESIPNS